VSFEPFFGGFVLETLTIGMYGEARNAIREYIQNGFDSIERAIGELKILKPGAGLIEITLAADRKSLTIRDNGAGLPAKTAANLLTRVGASGKSHRKNAGFRGIGRLAGIVFSDAVSFTTKAKGEREQTRVLFKAKAMRAAMSPGKGSNKSAQDLMKDSVEAYQMANSDVDGHFFEVKLDGFSDAPDECLSAKEMYDFVSQVAPVPYPADFPYRAELRDAEKTSGISIDEVNITITDGDAKPVSVTKRYGSSYAFESGTIKLSECSVYYSPTERWWAWVGKKKESGAYTDTKVSGLRMRVRNIQIDGTAIVRDIFGELGKSHVRFQDYFLGEVFTEPSVLVPNARRDGFEEDAAWKQVRKELTIVVKKLRNEAYKVSKQGGRYSVEALRANLLTAKKELKILQRGQFRATDRVITLSKSITTYQSRVAKSALGADLETATELQAIGSAFADIKHEALSHVAAAAASIDREKVQQETRDEFLQEVLRLLESALAPDCFATARSALLQEFGVE
jgi:Histidine kinase-, DNA gyrase B-, and HSP90-like ATPase